MAPKSRFTEGEKVLCFHGPLLYEAKCIKSQIKDRQVKYFIHYSGWNKNWDEWVPESRVLKHNEANLQKQKELEKAHVKTKKNKQNKVALKKDTPNEKERAPTPSSDKPVKQKAPPTPAPVESSSEKERKKRSKHSEQNIETEEEYLQKIEIKITVPNELKIWLVDDFSCINDQKKLVKLPARICVDDILEEYVKAKEAEKGINCNKLAAIEELCNGIREYFNVMLPKQLLYAFEIPQHQQIIIQYPEKPMTQIYGVIHLLRLFGRLFYFINFLESSKLIQTGRLGSILAYTVSNDEAITVFMNHFQDFAKFLSRPSQNVFSLSDYEPASAEYLKKVL